MLFDDFAKALSKADIIILPDIYASAREQPDPSTSSEKLTAAIKLFNPNVYYFPKTDEITGFLKKNKKPGDIVITVGAGDVFLLHPAIINALEI